jgi:glucose/arabinose dehydrogenase
MLRICFPLIVLAGPALVLSQEAPPQFRGPDRYASEAYAGMCAGCHGVDLAGGRAKSLFNPALLTAFSDDALLHFIMTGVPGTEMRSFREQLSDDQAWQIIAYLRRQSQTMKPRLDFVPNPANKVIASAKQKFRIEVVADGLDTPWGLAFLPDGRLLVTERSGNLRIVGRDGKLAAPVSGTPRPFVRQDAGLLDVAVHPDYARNGWIYLAYTEIAPGATVPPGPAPAPGPGNRQPGPPTMTVVIRGKVNANNEWSDAQTIYRAPVEVYSQSVIHYGSRLLLDRKGHLFFTLGERGEMTYAQQLSSPLGKIHRVNVDGSIPRDNPFVNTPGAIASIWSLGHRNPQGLAFDPRTGLLWESEHGPTGGDEINVIEKGRNYGWGVISMGVQPGITRRSAPGMEQPIVYYTPAIAPSGIYFYGGDRYPAWKNNLFVSGLVGQALRRLEIKDRTVIAQEVLFEQFGRVRAIAAGPDGLLYVELQDPTGSGTNVGLSAATPGRIVRLVPQA